jgi:hypothetical protein
MPVFLKGYFVKEYNDYIPSFAYSKEPANDIIIFEIEVREVDRDRNCTYVRILHIIKAYSSLLNIRS